MIALAGLSAGALHVVSGPDHLAALGPVASARPKHAVRLGALWGLGHGVGVLIAAGLVRAVGSAFDLSTVSTWAEVIVGVALIALGVRSYRGFSDHRHTEGSVVGIGVLHGTAGAHHLLAVLPSVAMTPSDAVAYLGAYLIAAIAAMATAGGLIRLVMRGRDAGVLDRVRKALSVVTTLVGAVWIATTLVG